MASVAAAGGNTGAPPRRASWVVGLPLGAIVVAAETALGWFLLDHHLADIVMLYLLGVVVVAMRFGYAPSLLAATLSVAAFDFFFTAPYFSFAVEDKRLVLTFVIMLFVAFVISDLTERIRRAAVEARWRELRTARLYAITRELSVARSTADIVRAARRHLSEAFGCEVAVLLSGEDGGVAVVDTGPAGSQDLGPAVIARANEMLSQAPPRGSSPAEDGASAAAATPSGAAGLLPTGEHILPLAASTGTQGALVVRPGGPDPFMNLANLELLEALASQIALAVERCRLGESAQRVQLEVQRERLRNALLSSVSHDLRTPLAVVKGAVTALLEREDDLPARRRHEYLQTISGEASRLNRLVRNLLDMTSLEAGALRVQKEWQPLEEVVGVALNRLDEQLADRPVAVRIAAEASLAPFDATLVEQVLVNLIENAVKYTPPRTPIEISARRLEASVEVEVADRGPGVPAGQEEAIFEKFRRAADERGVGGMGLGLTICRGIVAAHGGRIWCENRPGGGASFRFVLPREGEPALPALPEASGEAGEPSNAGAR